MLWLEMSRDITHGGKDWGFGLSLWSPVKKQNPDGSEGGKWGFWDTMLQVEAGDTILHLRGKDDEAAFVGFSTAASNGFETLDRPLDAGPWSYASSFFRVILKDYTDFPRQLLLKEIFKTKDKVLREYYLWNKSQSAEYKKRLFYVIQSGRLQCLNGAYLSEVDAQLQEILFGTDIAPEATVGLQRPAESANVNERYYQLKARVGQKDFSDNVRKNYSYQCCYPGCEIQDRRFLVGSHIARWTDAPQWRGETSNGLCLCLMHDKAFELGYFTLKLDGTISVNKNHPFAENTGWYAENLIKHDGLPILQGEIAPLADAIRHHWARIKYIP